MKAAPGLLLALAALAGGCGWHAGLVVPEGAETIGVEWFSVDENVLRRDLEPEIQRELTRAVSDLVDLRLVDPREADLVLTGTILNYRRRGGIRGPEHQLLESAVNITIETRLERRATGAILSTSRSTLPSGFVTADRTVIDPVTGQPIFLVGEPGEEERARARALRILAEGLVLDLFTVQDAAVP